MSRKHDSEIYNDMVKITTAALGSSSASTKSYVESAKDTAYFMQVVFDKLKEINESCES